jgi:hypothetical protein
LPRAHPSGTPQRSSLCRVPIGALDKGTSKGGPLEPSLLSARIENARQSSITITWRRDGNFSLPSARQRSLCRCTVHRVLFAESNTRQRVCRVFFGLALGKAVVSGSVETSRYLVQSSPTAIDYFKSTILQVVQTSITSQDGINIFASNFFKRTIFQISYPHLV